MEPGILTDLKQIRLENRLCIWHKKITGDNAVSLRLVIQGGSAHQKLSELGLAHFVEHLVFGFEDERTGAKQLVAEIEQSGGYINAITGLDSTVFVAEVPADKLGHCLELIDSCVSQPDFSEETINKEKQIILNELANDDSDFWNNIFRKVLGPCALTYSGIGTPQTLKRISKDKIEKFYTRHYVLNKMTLIGVGDVELAALRDVAISKIKRLRSNDEPREHYSCPEGPRGYLKISEPRANNSIIYGFRVPGSCNQGKEYYIFWFIRDFLDKQLFNFVREKGLSYHSEVCYTVNNISGLFYFYVRYIKTGRRAVIQKCESLVNDLKNKPLDAAQFDGIKTEVVNQYIQYLKDKKGLADCFQQYADLYEDVHLIKDDLLELRALTPEDIQVTAKKYFIHDKTFAVWGGYKNVISKKISPFLVSIVLLSLFERLLKAESSLTVKILLLSTTVLAGVVVWLIIDRRRQQDMLLEMRDEIKKNQDLSK
ncbi:MAG: pitrilysin family protein [Candidatus Omnitrophota bacterium]